MTIAPVGGAGLISGIASAAKQINPNIKIIGVGAKGAPAMYESFHAKQIKNFKNVRTIADGIAVRDVNPINFDIIFKCVDDFI